MQAAGKGQSLVTTFNLQGQGLYPLSDQGKQALLSAVNQTLAAKGDSVTNITLGQVTVRAPLFCGWLHLYPNPRHLQCKQDSGARNVFRGRSAGCNIGVL